MSLNRYVILFALCAAFLVLVCLRSYAPYPNYRIPHTPIVPGQALPRAGVPVEKILEPKAAWTDSSRNSFDVHGKYVPAVIRHVANQGTVANLPPGKGTTRIRLTQVYDHDRLPERGLPGEGIDGSAGPGDLRGAGGDESPRDGLPGSGGEEPVPAEAYRLPFRFMGIIDANEPGGPMVLLRDEATGRLTRRREGQTYRNEVHILHITPNSVEVDVPSRRLRLRYIDSLREWKPVQSSGSPSARGAGRAGCAGEASLGI
jgi:hypothetical protein